MLNVVLGKNHSYIKMYVVDKNGKPVLDQAPGPGEEYTTSLAPLGSGIYRLILVGENNELFSFPVVVSD